MTDPVTSPDEPTPADPAADAAGPHASHLGGTTADQPAEATTDGDELPPVVDWSRTGRRMTTSLAVIGTIVVVTWIVVAAVSGELRGRLLGELLGIGLLVSFVVEVVVIGGAALRGLVRAGDRGERLAGSDVSLLPPQVLRRKRR